MTVVCLGHTIFVFSFLTLFNRHFHIRIPHSSSLPYPKFVSPHSAFRIPHSSVHGPPQSTVPTTSPLVLPFDPFLSSTLIRLNKVCVKTGLVFGRDGFGLVWFGYILFLHLLLPSLSLSFQLCLLLSSLTLLSNSLCFFFSFLLFFLRACSCGQVLRTHVWFVVRSLVLVYVVFFFSCFYYSLRVSVFLCYRDGFPRSSILDVLSTLL